MFTTRIKQFISATTGKITAEDKKYVNRYLNDAEQRLFYQMDIPTQRHALNVSYTCQKLAKDYPEIDADLLIKAALLHDCGKKAGEIKTIHRIIIVLSQALLPPIAAFLAKAGAKGKFRSLGKAFYIQKIHCRRGAAFAENIAVDEKILFLIRNHHQKIKNPPAELILLQKADDLN